MSNSLWPHESQDTRPPCPSPTPRVHSNSHPSSRWCHPAISSSGVPFSSCPQSLPALESFSMSQLFSWGGRSIGVSASASVLPMNTQDWFPLEWTGWITLKSKGLSRVFSNTTVQKHQFFGAQPSSQSNSHIHAWPLEKPSDQIIRSVVSDSATPWITARQASLSITNSRSSLRLMSIKSVMPSSHLILCRPILLLPPTPPSIRVFSNESTLHMRWPKYWTFSFSIIPSKEISGPISFRMD